MYSDKWMFDTHLHETRAVETYSTFADAILRQNKMSGKSLQARMHKISQRNFLSERLLPVSIFFLN